MTRVRKMERIRVELEPMLEEVKSRCRIRPPVDLRVDLAPKPFSLYADPVQLRQGDCAIQEQYFQIPDRWQPTFPAE